MHFEIFCLRQMEFWALPHVLDQLNWFGRHTWFALSVFVYDGKFLLKAVFWGYPTILGQLNCRMICLMMEILAQGSWNFELVQLFLDTWIVDWFVRHVWFALSFFSWDGKFLLKAVFWGYLTFLKQLDCRLFSLVMENSCSGQLKLLACPIILGHLDFR